MAIPKSAPVLAAIIAIALTGCTQPDPNAAPTYTCTPSTGTPQPCYKAEHDLQVKEDKLYAEAEVVYRKFLAENERINRIGGVTEATPVMLETLTGEYLTQVLDAYQVLVKRHATAVGGEFKIAWVKPAPGVAIQGSVTALRVCTDASSVRMSAEGSPTQPGRRLERTGYFVREGDRLKISASEAQEVSHC